MESFLLLIFLFFAWSVWIIACCAEKAVDEKRRGIPREQRGGVSIAPGIPIFPLLFWLAALELNRRGHGHLGTWVIGIFHAVLLLHWIFAIALCWFRLRKLDKTHDA